MHYQWRGNIRELENMIERAVVMGTQSSIYRDEISRLKRLQNNNIPESYHDEESLSHHLIFDDLDEPSLEDIERRYIFYVLTRTGGNQKQAAEILDINTSTLWRKLKRYDIDLAKIKNNSRVSEPSS